MRQTTIFTLLVAAIMGVAVFYLKYEVTDLEAELERLNHMIVSDREAVHVLKAEWSHLNNADRIKGLADKYLQMDATRPAQLIQPDEVPIESFAERQKRDLGHKGVTPVSGGAAP
ncbi:MAG: hypothetical protein O3A84_02045 [Proteobacteria bacterium]|nr:hypothetical protein [Pseudomonadota bacterium]